MVLPEVCEGVSFLYLINNGKIPHADQLAEVGEEGRKLVRITADKLGSASVTDRVVLRTGTLSGLSDIYR